VLPVEVLRAWFAAHAAGDTAAARSLILEDAEILVPGGRLHGFDALMEWYRQRSATEPTFAYQVTELLSGEEFAAAVLTMRRGSEQWRQMVLYGIQGGLICSIWAVEDR